MKFLTVTFATFALLGGSTVGAQPADVAASSPGTLSPARTDEQLDTLLGPIALYPDTLIAVILPASTLPSDLVLAARYLQANGKDAAVDDQDWEDSVKSLAHYPEVLKWMDDNLAWTKQLGDAFASQPAEVMKAIQRLRARARAAGSLQDTYQQKIAVEGEVIAIQPAQPDVIYVPRYDPQLVYVDRPYDYYPSPYITFGIGFPLFHRSNYRCDWQQEVVYVGPRRSRAVWPSGPNLRTSPGAERVWVPSPHRFSSFGFAAGEHREIERREIVRPHQFGRTAAEESARIRNEHISRPWDRSPEAAVSPYRKSVPPQADNPDSRTRAMAPSAGVLFDPSTVTPRGEGRAQFRDRAGDHPQGVPPGTRTLSPSVPVAGSLPLQSTAVAPRGNALAGPSVGTPAPQADESRRPRDHTGEHREGGPGGGRFLPPSAAPAAAAGVPVPVPVPAPAAAAAPPARVFVPHHVPAPSSAAVAPPAAAVAPTQVRAAPAQPVAAPAVRQAAPAPSPAAPPATAPAATSPATDGAARGGPVRDGTERYRNRS